MLRDSIRTGGHEGSTFVSPPPLNFTASSAGSMNKYFIEFLKSWFTITDMRTLAFIVLCLFMMGCSSIRMNYSADLNLENGQEAKFSFKKSYDVSGGIPLFCGLTAIFLGGACWYYLAMPTVPQERQFEEDAKVELNKKVTKSKFTISSQKIERDGWSDKSDEVDFSFAK